MPDLTALTVNAVATAALKVDMIIMAANIQMRLITRPEWRDDSRADYQRLVFICCKCRYCQQKITDAIRDFINLLQSIL